MGKWTQAHALAFTGCSTVYKSTIPKTQLWFFFFFYLIGVARINEWLNLLKVMFYDHFVACARACNKSNGMVEPWNGQHKKHIPAEQTNLKIYLGERIKFIEHNYIDVQKRSFMFDCMRPSVHSSTTTHRYIILTKNIMCMTILWLLQCVGCRCPFWMWLRARITYLFCILIPFNLHGLSLKSSLAILSLWTAHNVVYTSLNYVMSSISISTCLLPIWKPN